MPKPVRVQIPPSLRRLTGGTATVELTATTVRDLIEQLDSQFPGMRARLTEDDRLKPGIAVAIDSRISSTGLTTPIPPGAEVQFLPAVAGG